MRAIYDALGNGDVNHAASLLSPDVAWHEPDCVPWAGVRHGREGFLSVLEDIDASTEDARFEPGLRYVGDDQDVAVIGTFSGTVRSTRTPASWAFVDLLEVRDRQVVRFESFMDTRRQLLVKARIPAISPSRNA